MARIIIAIVFLSLTVMTVNGQGSLLEMSQQLWTKLLLGGFSKTGKLDPLRVPVIKVDQSEGNTSYRIILRNVEITGLNASTLESIHIARGRLKSNLSELEAGYVSYSDLRDLDAIRYRFHTLIKEPKSQTDSFEAIVSATDQNSKFMAKEEEGRLERFRQYDPFLMKIQADKMKQSSADQSNRKLHQESGLGSFNMEGARVLSKSETSQIVENLRYPADVQMIYAMSAINSGLNSKNEQKENYDRSRTLYSDQNKENRGQSQRGEAYDRSSSGSYSEIRRQGQRAENYDRPYIGPYSEQARENIRQNQRGENYDSQYRGQSRQSQNFGNRAEQRYDQVEASASENVESRVADQRFVPGYLGREQAYRGGSMRLEKQPGYIDIVYADGSNNGSMRRFGNGRIDSSDGTRVYGTKDSEDILGNKRIISRNCTDGESLTKRNDAVKAAIATKKLDGLSRYARDYQEKQGYFEEGMQLLYHYGGMDRGNREKLGQGARHKRAHRDNETDDDVMHVIMKIKVPLLRVKSDYQLTGKVGQELVRGNGKLSGNFTELIGDFTVELKKVKNQDMLIVRAARSKLSAKKQDVSLQGMDEKGAVKSILTNGLMAAEAVAAMLADDLATKALNDKTADAMIYRMYKNLPVH